MPQTYSTELAGIASTPVVKPTALAYGARIKRFRASVALASQAFGAGNEIILAKVPAGYTFAYGVITSDTSLSTSTVSVGISGTVAKYKAAAVFTSVDTPTLFGTTAQIDNSPLTAEETVFAQVLIANLPASGNLVVDLYFTEPN